MADAVGEVASLEGRVAVVTGGGGGVGGAVAVELARRGAAVVVNDIGVDVTGTGAGDTAPGSTVERITSAGGTAVADGSSVVDAEAVADMVGRTVERFGRLDILVNAAGIVAGATLDRVDQDAWDRLLGVHVSGHLHCVAAALPVMARQGYGRVLNVTSGAGLQRVGASTVAYGTAKRAVAALTWALARTAPEGVTVNALSPIAATRMVAGAGRPGGPGGGAAGGGAAGGGASPGEGGATPSAPLDLGNMPPPDALAPVVAYLCGDRTSWLHGRVVFTNGVEASLVAPPRLIERVHHSAWAGRGMADAMAALVVASAVAGATTGGSMPRLTSTGPAQPDRPVPAASGGRAALVVASSGPAGAALGAPLVAAGWRVAGVGPWEAPAGRLSPTVPDGFDAAERLLSEARARLGRLDALVVHSGDAGADPGGGLSPAWPAAILDRIRAHAAFSRAVARADGARPVTVHAVASSATGAVVAQAVTQLTRCLQADGTAIGAAPTFSVEAVTRPEPAGYRALAELVAWLCSTPHAAPLAAEELVAGDDWVGVRSHPAASFTASFGVPVPEAWLDDALRAGAELR